MRTLSKTGFTLVELLVVMAILSLLVSIIVPSLAKVRDNARSTLCKSNLRQIGFAQYLYSVDNDDRYTEHFGISGISWQDELLEYISSKDRVSAESVLSCPARLNQTGNQASLGINRFIDFAEWNFSVDAVVNQSETILVGDMLEGDNDILFPSDAGQTWGTPGFRHHEDELANMVFADQHIESLNFNALTQTNTHWRWWE